MIFSLHIKLLQQVRPKPFHGCCSPLTAYTGRYIHILIILVSGVQELPRRFAYEKVLTKLDPHLEINESVDASTNNLETVLFNTIGCENEFYVLLVTSSFSIRQKVYANIAWPFNSHRIISYQRLRAGRHFT